MGRQHTMYMSDATWEQLEGLIKDSDSSMSGTIRRCIQICHENMEHWDVIKLRDDEIKRLENMIAMLCEDED